MSDIRLDPLTFDIDVQNDLLSLTSGLDARRQHLRQRLGMFFGEWFLNTQRGIPYFEHVFGKTPNPVVIDSIFKNEIINTQGVLELLAFELDLDTVARELTLTMRARVDEGILEFEETFGT